MASFRHLKVGDNVTRMLAGTIPMPMRVTKIDGHIITCVALEENGDVVPYCDWTFHADNGGEIDEELGWNPPHTPTGSVLVTE